MANKSTVTLRRVSEVEAYAQTTPAPLKPEDFLNEELVLMSYQRMQGKVKGADGKIRPYFIMKLVRLDDIQKPVDEREEIVVQHGGQFFQDFFSALDPHELPLVCTFRVKGNSVYME